MSEEQKNVYYLKTPRNEEEVEELFQIGYKFEKGIIFNQDYGMAKNIYEKCASFNHPMAFNNLGWLYHNGLGVKKNIKKAEEYYFMAAMHGETTAMINLANIYEFNEKHLDKIDWKTARTWYQRAALCGDLKGLMNYANCLHYGNGGPKDQGTAFFIFRLLAGKQKGAYFYLGLYYEKGLVVKKNIPEACRQYLKGIEQEEDGYCCTQLGNICVDGIPDVNDGKPDYEAAAKYYLTAIKFGDNLGYANIGNMYEKGFVTGKKDKKMAIRWYQLGAQDCEENCEKQLKRLGVELADAPDYNFDTLAAELYNTVNTDTSE